MLVIVIVNAGTSGDLAHAADHGDPPTGDNGDPSVVAKQDKQKEKFRCEYCPKSYVSYGGLYLHVREVHVTHKFIHVQYVRRQVHVKVG